VDTKVEYAVDTNKQTLLDRLLSFRWTQTWVWQRSSSPWSPPSVPNCSYLLRFCWNMTFVRLCPAIF